MSNTTLTSTGGCSTEQYSQVMQALHGDAAAAIALCQVFATSNRTEEVALGLNTVFKLVSGALVFIMVSSRRLTAPAPRPCRYCFAQSSDSDCETKLAN